MHPEIIRDAPGSCPICGMALEPRTAVAQEQENPELIDMRRRFRVSTVLTVPLVLVAMRSYIPGLSLEDVIASAYLKWAGLVLGTPVVLWGAGRSSSGDGGRLKPQPEHIHSDRTGNGHRLCIQRDRRRAAGYLPGILL